MSVLKLTRVTKTYGSGAAEARPLQDVNFELESREVVAVTGPSGSGKTTLLTIAGALQAPTSGIVEIDGEEVQRYSQIDLAHVRRHKVGFIFQSFNLLEALSAQENIEFALNLSGHTGAHGRERARQLLSMLDLGGRAHALPRQMSGGERQRVAIARALANDGNLILADEPTASLDHKRAIDTLVLLRGITRDLGRSLLVVTHDMRAHDYADRIFWLEDGLLEPVAHGEVHTRPHDSADAVSSEVGVAAAAGTTTLPSGT
jgi:putative ABC transport system ATP-binding protein